MLNWAKGLAAMDTKWSNQTCDVCWSRETGPTDVLHVCGGQGEAGAVRRREESSVIPRFSAWVNE